MGFLLSRTQPKSEHTFSLQIVLANTNPAVRNMSEGNEAGSLQGPAGGNIGWIAAGGGNRPIIVGDLLELLHEIRAKPPAAIRFVDVHVNITVRNIVMKHQPALADSLSVKLQVPLTATLTLMYGLDKLGFRR